MHGHDEKAWFIITYKAWLCLKNLFCIYVSPQAPKEMQLSAMPDGAKIVVILKTQTRFWQN